LVIIGAAVGWAMLHHGSTWLRQQFATTSGEITYGLVGVAGSFMGYFIGGILGVGAPILLYILAAVGAVLTIYLWRGR
ncbi:MAG: transglycosylase, partial [Hyphomicrobium sp.]